MTSRYRPRVDTTVLGAASLLALARAEGPAAVPTTSVRARVATSAAVVGAWRSPDGTVRLRLHTDGTYAGEVAGRRRPARGTYLIGDAELLLHDDSGLRTPVTVLDGELEMAGHRLLPGGFLK